MMWPLIADALEVAAGPVRAAGFGWWVGELGHRDLEAHQDRADRLVLADQGQDRHHLGDAARGGRFPVQPVRHHVVDDQAGGEPAGDIGLSLRPRGGRRCTMASIAASGTPTARAAEVCASISYAADHAAPTVRMTT